jgi:MFS family permease
VATAMANYAVPFYAVYARRALSAPENAVGTYLVVRTGTSVVSNLVLGRVADRFGSRRVARLAALTVALAPLTALVVAAFPGNAAQKGALLAVVFAVQGLHVGAQVIGSTNYVLELAPSIERVTYISVANGVAGLAVLSSPLGGAIADQLGFVPLFVLALVCGAVAVWMAWGLQEPREAVAPPS